MMSGETGGMVRMVVLGLGVVLLDYSSQAAINPCEALMSDMMAVMNSGKIVEYGPSDSIYANPQNEYTRKLIAAIPGSEGRRKNVNRSK